MIKVGVLCCFTHVSGVIWGAGSMRPVYVEDSPAALELIEEAAEYVGKEEMTAAAQRLQRLIEEYPNKLMRLNEDVYRDCLFYAHEQLLGHSKLLAVYREMHEPLAERMLMEAMAGDDEMAGLKVLVMHYGLTRSGLEGGLLLTGAHLERAESMQAIDVLKRFETHPDLKEVEGRYWRLQYYAAVLRGDVDEQERLVERMRAAEVRFDRLSLSNQWIEVEGEAGAVDVKARLSLVAGEEAVPLWDTAVDRDDVAVFANSHQRSQYTVNKLAQQQALPVHGEVVGDDLVVNNGRQLVALNRYSGREHWVYEYRPELSEPTQFTLRRGRVLLDRRRVVKDEQRIYGVVGRAPAWTSRRQDEGVVTALVALNQRDGALRWMLRAKDLKDVGLERAYFHGTPELVDGVLYQIAERRPSTGFQDTYVLAVEAATGELIWKRHLASTARLNRNTIDTTSGMSIIDGVIYVTDYAGAVGAIELSTGAMKWVRLFDRKAGTRRRFGGQSSSLIEQRPKPMVVPGGLVVLPDSRVGSGMLLDLETGNEIKRLEDSHWQELRSLQVIDGRVVLVGKKAVIGLEALSLKKLWGVQISETGVDVLSGQVAYREGKLLVSASNRLLLIDVVDGEKELDLHAVGTGNVVYSPEQLMLVDAVRVRCYMPWSEASVRLVDAIDEESGDVNASLALAHVAMRHKQFDLYMRGVDSALAVLERLLRQHETKRYDEAQQIVFHELFEMAEQTGLLSDRLRQILFNRLAAIVRGSQQEAKFHFAAGLNAERTKNYKQAVEHYQAVIIDRELARTMYAYEHITRPAEYEAKIRLQTIIKHFGQQIYVAYDHIAELRLDELEALPGEQVAGLKDLAARYPFSKSTPRAQYLVGLSLKKRGESGSAVRHFKQAIAGLREQKRYGDVILPACIEYVVEIYADQGQHEKAMMWLSELRHIDQGKLAKDRSVGTAIAKGMSLLQEGDMHDWAYPTISLPINQLSSLKGQLVLMPGRPVYDPHYYVRDGKVLKQYSQTTDAVVWSHEMDDEGYAFIGSSADRLIAVNDVLRQMVSVDRHTGEKAWGPIAMGDLFEPIERGEQLMMEVMHDGGFAREAEYDWSMAMAGERMIVDDGRNLVVGIDQVNGKVVWENQLPVDEIVSVEADEERVIVVGLKATEGRGRLYGVFAVDLNTGEVSGRTVELAYAPLWFGMTDEGTVLFVFENGIHAYATASLDLLWRIDDLSDDLSEQCWLNDELLLVLDEDGLLHIVNIEDGRTVRRISMHTLGVPRMVTGVYTQGYWVMLTGSSAIAIDGNGQVAWRDTIVMPGRKILANQEFSNRYAIYLSAMINHDDFWERDPGQIDMAEDEGFRYRLYFLNRTNGQLSFVHRMPPMEKPLDTDLMQVIRHGVIVSNDERTYVLRSSQGKK